MLPRLSKVIGELEQEDLKVIWQPPDIYDQVMANAIWLIYGRKGSGKSTLVDYLGTDNPNLDVEIFRPGDTDLFRNISEIINGLKNEDRRLIEEAVSCAVDFVLTTTLMQKYVELSGALPAGSNRERIYNFLTNQELIDGSVLFKAINFVSKATQIIKSEADVGGVLRAVKGNITFDEAKRAFFHELKTKKKKLILCIDDIDEIGFSFSNFDRHFVNGLIMYMVKTNKRSIKEKTAYRVILTMPSELFFHSTLWGGDWVTGTSECLTWADTTELQALVNKRIAFEMNVKKNKREKDEDIYSVSTEHTWNKVFPANITNKLGREENTFEYIIRHTFYTPRHVLGLCDEILSHFHKFTRLEDVRNNLSSTEWSGLIQLCVEGFSTSRETDFRKLFSCVYKGLDDVLCMFESRPFIWNRHQLSSYIANQELFLERTDTGEKYRDIALIDILQQIGFLGLGTQSVKPSPTGTTRYDMHFSFLEKLPYRGGWDIAVISPMFYDTYDIKPVDNIRIIPHQHLTLTHRQDILLSSYNEKTNQFTTRPL